jgi:hypothetical protein
MPHKVQRRGHSDGAGIDCFTARADGCQRFLKSNAQHAASHFRALNTRLSAALDSFSAGAIMLIRLITSASKSSYDFEMSLL